MSTKIKHLVISGGSINGLSFLGCLDYLDEYEMLTELEKITGSSIGSIIGLLYLVGMDSVEMAERYHSYSWNQLMDPDFNIRSENFSGLIKGLKIINILSDILIEYGFEKRITFKELYEKTSKEFYITGVNCYTRKTEYFSHINTPNMTVLKAIRISIAIPFVFKPVVFNGDVYMDGSTLDKLPLEKCQDIEETLIISYKPEQKMDIVSNLSSLIQHQTECSFPLIMFDQISHNDDYLHVILRCYKQTEYYFNKKIL